MLPHKVVPHMWDQVMPNHPAYSDRPHIPLILTVLCNLSFKYLQLIQLLKYQQWFSSWLITLHCHLMHTSFIVYACEHSQSAGQRNYFGPVFLSVSQTNAELYSPLWWSILATERLDIKMSYLRGKKAFWKV